MTTNEAPPASSPRNPSPCPAFPPATPRCARSAAAATTCITAATTSSTSPSNCEFEEIAYLLVHGKLPNAAELANYKPKLKALRGLPRCGQSRARMRAGRGAPDGRHAHRLFGAGHRAAGEGRPQPARRARHRRPPDGLVRLDAALLVPLQPQRPPHRGRDRRRFDRRPFPAPAARQGRRRRSWVRAMHTSLNLYAEHEFNASTFACRVVAGTGADMYSAITGGIGALRGPKHGGANEVGIRGHEPLPDARRRRKRHRRRASPTRKS